MSTWRNGQQLLEAKLEERGTSIKEFIAGLESSPPHRIPGTAGVMVGSGYGYENTIPAALIHHLQCVKVLHERVILLAVETGMVPHVPAAERLEYENLGAGVISMRFHYGFSQTPNVPVALALSERFGLPVDPDTAIYIVARETVIPRLDIRSLPYYWQEVFFSWLTLNAGRATAYYNLPAERVLELGLQVEI